MPNPMALVWSLYDVSMVPEKSKFQEKSSIKWGQKPSKWNVTYPAVLLGSHSTPTPYFRTLHLNLPVKNQEKTS